jgi:hypothetical protein
VVVDAGVRRWAAYGVTVLAIALLVVGTFAVAPPLASQPAFYLADRNAGLAILLSVLLIGRWTRPLGAVLMATAAMHLADGAGDVLFGNAPAAIGSFAVAALSAVAALHFLRNPS